MKIKRESYINKYFTNIQPDIAYLDRYTVRKAILEALNEQIPSFYGKLLDLGCGIMPYKELILENNKVTEYIGVDFDNSLNEEYASVKPELNWDGLHIPMPNESVDIIIATEVLEHCPNPNAVLAEAYRVLKKNGKLFLTVPFIWNLHLTPYDEYRYTPFALKRLLVEAGFENPSLKALGCYDASLAQMLGIWFEQRPLGKRRIIGFFLKKIIVYLLKKDAYFNKAEVYKEGLMLTGISAAAYKK